MLNLNTEIEIKMAEVRDRPAILISIPSNLNTNSGVHAKERIRKWHIRTSREHAKGLRQKAELAVGYGLVGRQSAHTLVP